MNITSEEKIILSTVKIQLSSTEIDTVNSLLLYVTRWDYLVKLLIERGLAPLFYSKIKLFSNSSIIPTSIFTLLRKTYYTTLNRNVLIYEHFNNLITETKKDNLNITALKGIYLAENLYGDIGLRQMSDIDLLIAESDSYIVLSILDNLGYKVNNTDVVTENANHKMHFKPRVLNNIPVEIHTKLQDALNNNDFVNQTKHLSVGKVEVNVLNDNEQLIHLCVHLHNHFEDGHVQFTCFADIVNFIEKLSLQFDWSLFEKDCERYNVTDIVFKHILLSSRYFNAVVPFDIIDKYNYCLTKKDEMLFINYLRGFESFNSRIPKIIDRIKHSATTKQKIPLLFTSEFFVFILKMLFPSKNHISTKYNISIPALFWLWYPRWYAYAIVGFIKMIFTKNTSRIRG